MGKNDVYLSYAHRDREIADALAAALRELGHTVLYDAGLLIGNDFAKVLGNAIVSCDCFVPLITDAYVSSVFAREELSYAFTSAEDRSKTILPIMALREKELPANIRFYIHGRQCLSLRSLEDIPPIAAKIHEEIAYASETAMLYEKLAEYSRLKNDNREAETICRIVDLLCGHYEREPLAAKRRNLCGEIWRLYERLGRYVGGYDDESRKTVHRILDTLDRVGALIGSGTDEGSPFTADRYFCAFALHAIWQDREIRSECADVITNGDVKDPCPVKGYIEKQKPFAEAFRRLGGARAVKAGAYSAEERAFIEETSRFIFDPSAAPQERPKPERKTELPKSTEEDEILLSVANFMQEGNRLFDVLQKNRLEGSFLKCLLTSYERLKAYCEVVGAETVAAECVDRIVELREAVEKQPEDGGEDGKAEKGLKSLLGLSLHDGGSYDVFISYKSEDSDLAEKIYKYCQKHLKEAFWSKRSLPELSKSEYEDAIYTALRNSRHFVVVLSDLKYLQANWIKKEMSTFDRAITEGRKPGGNFVLVVTEDVYQKIIDSKKMCLDERYCGYQIIRMSEYETTLYQYL